MKKCKTCKGKDFIFIKGEQVCSNCSINKEFVKNLLKKNQKEYYNNKLEDEQKINTNKSYLRFRIFVVENK